MKNPLSRMPFVAPNLLPPLPPQFQFGNAMANPMTNGMSSKNPQMAMPNQMNLEAMQHLFMQSPLFQHFQKQFMMQQQMFAQQQQFLLEQQKKQNGQQKSTTNNAKSNSSLAQKRNKLSIDEILKQRVKPTQVTNDQDDHPTGIQIII